MLLFYMTSQALSQRFGSEQREMHIDRSAVVHIGTQAHDHSI